MRRGKFLLRRKSRRDRMQAKLNEIMQALRERMHQPIPEQGTWLSGLLPASTTTMPCRPMVARCGHSAMRSPGAGRKRWGVVVKKGTSAGSEWKGWQTTGSPGRASSTPGQISGSPSSTRGESRMHQTCTYGSERGARGNPRPYRDITSRHSARQPYSD
jgi:hypothetical protein